MDQTQFHTVHGLPARNGKRPDLSTARDLALLARACVRQPLVMDCVGRKTCQLRPDAGLAHNTNRLLWRMADCDGLKTGWIRVAGFCVTATAQRNGIRLVAVVMGAPTPRDRFDQAQRLLEEGFARVRRVRVVDKGQRLGPSVSVPNYGPVSFQLAAGEDLWVTVRASDVDRLEVRTSVPSPMPAAVRPGEPVGEVRVLLVEEILARAPLTVPATPDTVPWRLGMPDYATR